MYNYIYNIIYYEYYIIIYYILLYYIRKIIIYKLFTKILINFEKYYFHF